MGTCLALLLDPGVLRAPSEMLSSRRLGTSWRPATSAISGSRPPSRSFRSRCRPTWRTLTPTTCLESSPSGRGTTTWPSSRPRPVSRARTPNQFAARLRRSSRKPSRTCAKPSSCGPSSRGVEQPLGGRVPGAIVGCGDRGSPECAQGCGLCHARDGARQLGWAYYQKKDVQSAWKELHEAVSRAPGFCVARYRLAKVYLDRGETDQAMDALAPVVSDVKRCPIQEAQLLGGLLNERRGSWRRHGNYFSVVSTWPAQLCRG